ncbi:MAG: hypothetical protein H7099_18375 [Gemmatimonadaceae bacterium]|nr:hypothetical protein [Gemmatimonadaceae bacterium]
MTDAIVRVFVNARGYDVPAAASALDAVRVADVLEADAVVAGTRQITDSRGLAVPTGTPVYAGVIYRVVANRARDGEGTT